MDKHEDFYEVLIAKRVQLIGRTSADIDKGDFPLTFLTYARDLIKRTQSEIESIAKHEHHDDLPANIVVNLRVHLPTATVSHNESLPHFSEVFRLHERMPIPLANQIIEFVRDISQRMSVHLIVQYDLGFAFQNEVVKLLLEKNCVPNELIGTFKKHCLPPHKCDFSDSE